ncbi:MAG: ribose-5-phosphate isomerase RpiA [Phycisphaerales bacterium]|nr:ribose-5-phosphate isomerase RpiA [Phycisphaerales bacterium]MCB9835544.1 ribose-5-phosphate isomerase RpiA [Phycisphaera sp.]
MSEQQVVDRLAEAAVAPIQSGMLVGLGTGRTARRGVRALAERIREGNLKIDCVASSEATEQLARELELRVVDFALVEEVDYLFDGADEVDAKLRMLKGSGGAMTRERIVAWASKRRVYMVDGHKMVENLGTNATLPVAVMAYGLASTRASLRSVGLNGVCRRTMDGDMFITDNGNLILDVPLTPDHCLEELAAHLNDIPGVIDHGLFLGEADEILVDKGGKVDRLIRQD